MFRSGLLNKFLNMESSLDALTDELNKLDWDADEEFVALTRQHILNALEKYQKGKVNETEIENWANAIEVREDIGRETPYEDLINQVLYELANPYLTEPLTMERAKFLSTKLVT